MTELDENPLEFFVHSPFVTLFVQVFTIKGKDMVAKLHLKEMVRFGFYNEQELNVSVVVFVVGVDEGLLGCLS